MRRAAAGNSIKRSGYAAFSLSALGMIAAAPLAAAQEDIDPYALSPEQLFGATVISASRSEESLWDAAAAIYVITSADIERSGATSIPEALRLAPGVQVSRAQNSVWAISVRGFNTALANKLLVLIDGREVYDPLFSGVYWDIQDTAIEDIDRIEVIRGPGASLWGANAVNGVINIITKGSADTQGWMASAVAGNQERVALTARYGGALGDNAHWRVYGRYFDRLDHNTPAGAASNGDWQAWRGGFRIDAEPSTRDTITIQGDAYRSDTGQLRSVPTLSAPYALIQRDDISSHGANVLSRWGRALENGGQFTTQLYFDFTSRDQLSLKDQRSTADLDVQYEFPDIAAHDLIVGARFRHTAERITPTAIVYAADRSHDEDLLSAFVQDRITLAADAWYLTVGSKFDNNDYTGFEVQPNIRLQWIDGDRQTAWASISRAVRTPSELERELFVVAGVIPPAMFPVPVSVELQPSSSFESEELVAYEIGYRRQLAPNLQLDLTAFHNDYEGLATLTLLPFQVVAVPLHLLLPIAYTNQTDAQTHGVEAVMTWRASEQLNFSATYSFLDVEMHGPPANLAIASESAETTSPRNQANVRAQWDVSDAMSLDATLYYVDSLPAFQLDATTRLDLRFGWRLTDDVQLDLVGQGLLDDARREFGAASGLNATEIERSVYARLTWRS
jgi:iron complex outermembrane recepter protein